MFRAYLFSGVCVGATSAPPPAPSFIVPTLTKTNVAADPITFSWDGTSDLIGYYLNVQLAGDSAFTVDYPGEADIRETIRIITSTDFTDDDEDTVVEMDPIEAMLDQQVGHAYLRMRIGVDDGEGGYVWGDWSNTIDEDVNILTPTTLDPASISNPNLLLSNGNLSVENKNNGQGAAFQAKGTSPRTGKRYFEGTVNARTNIMYFGAVNSSHDTVTDHNDPGTGGVALRSDATVYRAPAATVYLSITYKFETAGKVVGVAIQIDESVRKIWFSVDGTWDGSPTAGTGGYDLPSGDIHPFVAVFVTEGAANNKATMNFGASSFAYTLPTGFEAWT